MLMLSLVRALAALIPLATRLATWLVTWLVARTLNMPEPLVHATGHFVVVQVVAFETSVGQSLCPFRLARRLKSLFR